MKQPPSRWYYGLAALIAAAGVALFAWLVWWQVSAIGRDLQRAIVPGAADISVRHPGKYLIYHEYHSVVDGQVFSTAPGISGLRVTLRDKSSQAPIPVNAPSVESSYDLGGQSAVAVLEFQVTAPTVVTLVADYPSSASGPPAVIAVGPAFAAGMTVAILGGVLLLLATLGASIWLSLLTYNRRRVGKA